KKVGRNVVYKKEKAHQPFEYRRLKKKLTYLIYKSMNAMFMNTYFQTMNRQHSVKKKKILKVIVIRKSKNTVNGHSLLITLKSKVNKLEINPKNIIIPLVTLF